MIDFFSRYESRIEVGAPSGCWLWSAGAMPDGYGCVRPNGRTLLTHRLAYEARHGVGAASGHLVRHRCDTPACVNPDHLVIGTPAQNSRDAVDRGRMARGEKVAGSRLTETDVRAIRAAYVPHSKHANQRALARHYGVDQGTIMQLLLRKTWRHVV
ncbi:HNH endonuclease [Brevundimonas sp.]|uniref:HNH endonuclease n=1 Tax=Brevundimonas sp. TaxID=1871086 RepID=UPI0028993A6D|nr:HNH endonuclease [Brevundimonas sp.]